MAQAERGRWFVGTEWLADRLAEVTVIDASWHLPVSGRNAKAEFAAAHIPGAVFFDIDAIADPRSSLPHMLPRPEDFAAMLGALGVADTDTIVVYDALGLYSAPRAWWSLKTMGASNVRILDGGLPAWQSEGRRLEAGTAARPRTTFAARFDAGAVIDIEALRRALADGSVQVVDGRPAPRFRGEAPEPRPGIRGGHMPGSLSLPGTDLVAGGRLLAAADLAQAFERAGILVERPIVTSCGSGVVAAILTLAAEMIGAKKISLYDGSWTEWGGRTDTPVSYGSG